MKKIENKNYTMMADKDRTATTVDLIKLCLNQPPQGGFNYEDLKNRERIDNALETMEFEDADFKNLVNYVKAMRWNIRHADILDFINEIVTK